MRILVVEDEEHLAVGLRLNLTIEGYDVTLAASAAEARQALVGPKPYDAIVLDVMLPDLDGFEICRQLRAAGNFTPVLMLTARRTAADRVLGLESGADDYLVKPFELAELLARIRSLLRRRAWDTSGKPTRVLRFGAAAIDFDKHEATMAGRAVQLTQLEFELLHCFSEQPRRTLDRAELLEKVWKLSNYPNTRTVDNFIMRLRQHFEPDPASPVHFVSVRGVGYRFDP